VEGSKSTPPSVLPPTTGRAFRASTRDRSAAVVDRPPGRAPVMSPQCSAPVLCAGARKVLTAQPQLFSGSAGEPEGSIRGTALATLENEVSNARLASYLGGARSFRPTPATAPALDLDQVAQDLARFEGSKAFMYQDSRGYVTTGVGHLLRTEAEAQKLPWVNSATGKPATDTEIDALARAPGAAPRHSSSRDGPTGRLWKWCSACPS
jgi:hypothetical protein